MNLADEYELRGQALGATSPVLLPACPKFALAGPDDGALGSVLVALEHRREWKARSTDLLDGIERDAQAAAGSAAAVPPQLADLERSKRVNEAVACQRVAVVAGRLATMMRIAGVA